MGKAPACRRLWTHLNGQGLWDKPQHPDATRTSPGRHPDVTQSPSPLPPGPCLHPWDIFKTNQGGAELPS